MGAVTFNLTDDEIDKIAARVADFIAPLQQAQTTDSRSADLPLFVNQKQLAVRLGCSVSTVSTFLKHKGIKPNAYGLYDLQACVSAFKESK